MQAAELVPVAVEFARTRELFAPVLDQPDAVRGRRATDATLPLVTRLLGLPLIRALAENGIAVVALHNHMLAEEPMPSSSHAGCARHSTRCTADRF